MENDDFEPTKDEILEYAVWLGMDPERDKELLWIAEEGLKAPVPDEWLPVKDDNIGEMYFVHTETGEKSWDHPCDEHYKQLYKSERKKQTIKLQPPTDSVDKQGGQPNADALPGKEGGAKRSPKSRNKTNKEEVDEERVELFKEMARNMLRPDSSVEEQEAVLQNMYNKGKADPNLVAALNEVRKELKVELTPASPTKSEKMKNRRVRSLHNNQEEPEKQQSYLEMAEKWIKKPELGEQKIIHQLSQIPEDILCDPDLILLATEKNLPKVVKFLKGNQVSRGFPDRKGKSPGPETSEELSQGEDSSRNLPGLNSNSDIRGIGLGILDLPAENANMDWVDGSNLRNETETMRTPEPIMSNDRAAILIQAMTRGVLARNYAVELLYLRAYRALTLIQAIARGWLVRKSLWSQNPSFRRNGRGTWGPNSPVKNNDRESWMMTWQRIVDKTPSYSDKVRFWQTVIEVKRVSPNSTNVEVMAALFEAKGNVQRSITILSSEEHAWRLKRALKGQQIPTYLLPVQKLPPRAQRLRRRRSHKGAEDKGNQRSKDIFPLIESIFMGEATKPTTLKKAKRAASSSKKKPGYSQSIGHRREVQNNSSSDGNSDA